MLRHLKYKKLEPGKSLTAPPTRKEWYELKQRPGKRFLEIQTCWSHWCQEDVACWTVLLLTSGHGWGWNWCRLRVFGTLAEVGNRAVNLAALPGCPCLKGFSILGVPRAGHAQVAQHHWHTGCFITTDIVTLPNFNWHSSMVQFNYSTCPWELRLLWGERLKCPGTKKTKSREQTWRSNPSCSSISFHGAEYEVVHISDCQVGGLTWTEFCQELHFRPWINEQEAFWTEETADWVMLLAKVLDFQEHQILLAHLLRLRFIFLCMCKNFPAAELVCSMENLSSLKSSMQLSKKLDGCEILSLRIVGYN